NDECPELERADHRRMPGGHPGQHDEDGITPLHAEACQRVHRAIGSDLHVPEREARGVASFVLPIERDAGPVGGPGVHHLTQAELGRPLPPEIPDEIVVATRRRDHAALLSPRRAETWMYLREMGEWSSGSTTASITTNRRSAAASTSAARSASARVTRIP